MLRSFEKRPEHVQALDRVKEWTRARFKLAEDVPILVSEVACGLPGCPPRETVTRFGRNPTGATILKYSNGSRRSSPTTFLRRG